MVPHVLHTQANVLLFVIIFTLHDTVIVKLYQQLHLLNLVLWIPHVIK